MVDVWAPAIAPRSRSPRHDRIHFGRAGRFPGSAPLPLCSVNAACRALNPCGGGSSPPRGTNDHVAIGRRDRLSWDPSEGDIVEGQDAALSAREYGFESRCPRQHEAGLVVQRPSDPNGIAIKEGRPNSLRTSRKTPGLHPGDEGSMPSESTRHSCGGKGRRPWRSHKPRHAGSIPASATRAGPSDHEVIATDEERTNSLRAFRKTNGRTAVLQTAHGGSIPSPATRSM